jgi:microcystin-dependent protein
MSDPFIGSIMLASFPGIPTGWHPCNGQGLEIATHPALAMLLGTTFGGDGVTTFGLPNLSGRCAVGGARGQSGGEANHTLTQQEMPLHIHGWFAGAAAGNATLPSGNALAAQQIYYTPSGLTPMNPATIAPAGGGQAHPNQSPYLVLNYLIALQGIVPHA